MGGMAAEEGMEPEWCSRSSSMRTANVLFFGHVSQGARYGTRCQGLLARTVLGLLLFLGAFG